MATTKLKTIKVTPDVHMQISLMAVRASKTMRDIVRMSIEKFSRKPRKPRKPAPAESAA